MLKLLIADDEKTIRETIRSFINWEALDIEVVGTAKDGIEAYNMILDLYPDIVLTDIRMPGLSGLELIERMHKINKDMQFIILSGYNEFEYAKTAMQYGVRHYLLKPCSEQQIIDSIKEIKQDYQIRMIQNNDTSMVEKIQTTIVNTIPLWKSQMVLALGIAHSTEAAQAQRQVTDLTNELLRKNAETLHTATVETARESERGIVDIETLQKTNADLIQTLDEVIRIQQEGHEKRKAAEAEMRRMENELKDKLLEIRK